MKTVNLFGKTWIFDGLLPGEKETSLQGFALRKKVYAKKTPYQLVEVADTEKSGRILLLDGLVQLSTKHEAVYHEMLVHPALLSCPSPSKVLIIGGGDGGTLREVLKHPVKEALLVEIDKEVLRVAKTYFPRLSRGAFQDPRAKIVIEDGFDVVLRFSNYFDCVILDSTDPAGGMAQRLFEKSFFLAVRRALKPSGVFSAQTGYLSDIFGIKARKMMKKMFQFSATLRAFVGSFPKDEHTFSFGSSKINLKNISLVDIQKRYKDRNITTSYYSPKIHMASSVFPLAQETLP